MTTDIDVYTDIIYMHMYISYIYIYFLLAIPHRLLAIPVAIACCYSLPIDCLLLYSLRSWMLVAEASQAQEKPDGARTHGGKKVRLSLWNAQRC